MTEMTKQEATLWARGADSVGGDLMLRNKVVATYRNGVFALTDDGVAELDVEEVEVVEIKTPTKKSSGKKAVGHEPAAVEFDETPLE